MQQRPNERLSKSFDLGGASPLGRDASPVCRSRLPRGNPLHDLERLARALGEKHEDQMTTLDINSGLLAATLEKKKTRMPPQERNAVISAEVRARALEETHARLLQRNFAMHEQLLDCKFSLETESHRGTAEIRELEAKNAVLTSMWNEKEKKCSGLQQTLRNKQKRAQGFAVQEKSIIDPTQQTLAMHNELQINRCASTKLNRKMSEEAQRRESLLKYNKKLKQRNEQLKAILKSILSSGGNLSDKTNIDMEKIKGILENGLTGPMEPGEEDIVRKADTSMNLPPQKSEQESEPSVASSIGESMPVKNDLSRSHDRIKTRIPMLDFTKIAGRLDLKAKAIEKRATVGGGGIMYWHVCFYWGIDWRRRSRIRWR